MKKLSLVFIILFAFSCLFIQGCVEQGENKNENVSVVDIIIDSDNNLQIILSNGETKNVGNIGAKNGTNGKSAYEIYKDAHPEYTKDEKEWLDDLVNGRLGTKEEVKYTVKFVTGTDTLVPSQEVAKGEKIKKPADPKRDEFVFDGWYIEDEKWSFNGYVVTSDMTLVAKWTPAINKQYFKITYHVEGGTLPEGIKDTFVGGEGYVLPDAVPTDPSQKFLGWYNEEGKRIYQISSSVYHNVVLYAKFGQESSYKALWEPNKISFDGNGMTFKIMVDDVSLYNPFDPAFKGTNASILKEHIALIEAAYNIVIEWTKWSEAAPWGVERVNFINNKYLNDKFGDVYAFEIYSSWIPNLVKAGAISELYDMNAQTGIFTGLSTIDKTHPGYIQDVTINKASSVKGKVYGYKTGHARPDYFMYYNVDKVKELNLDDPAELHQLVTR